MLSRVAESCFWMSRYIERAEDTARVIDVNFNLMLDLVSAGGHDPGWQSLIAIMAEDQAFNRHYGMDFSAENVAFFLTFDERNPNSILSSITEARTNARQIRDLISSEMWEQINSLYLMVADARNTLSLTTDGFAFYRAIKNGSHLFQGITDGTMTHGEGWEFIQIGKMLERADKTSRIVDVKYHILLPSIADVGGPEDIVQWMAVLKSCSALEAYRKVYVTPVDPRSVVEFLILHPVFPRSIFSSVLSARRAMRRLAKIDEEDVVGSERVISSADRSLGRLSARLHYDTIDDVFQAGMHEYLDGIQIDLNRVGDAMYRDFFSYTILPDDMGAIQGQQQQ